MKKIFSLMLLGLAFLLSCEKEGPTTLNKITDLYTAPDGATEMTLSGATSNWATDRRYFDLTFNNLTTTLVGYDALLSPAQYVIGADQIGNAINTKVNGQSASEGFITVGERDGQYQITATIGGKVYYWKGALPFTPDPAPTALSEVLSAQSNLGNGVKSLTMNLATPGISQEFDMTTWTSTWKGNGGYLALDIYSEDGYLHEGTYTASAQGGVINPNEFGIGYDTVMEYTDQDGNPQTYEAKDWGTCWWTVANGAATAKKITSGLVNVSSREEGDATIWTISWGAEYPVEVLFEGAIPALTKPKKPDGPVVPDYLYTEEVTPGDGLDLHAVTITDKDGNVVAYLELQTEVGAAELTGSYPSTSYASAPGQMRDGYFIDLSQWGMEGTMEGGSYYVENGEKQFIGAGTATVEVTPIATGAYNFTCVFFSYNAAGPDYVPDAGGDVGDALPAKDVVTEHAAGVDKHTITIGEGDDIVAVFELLTATGADFEGSFVSTEYAAEPGMLCNGYSFPDWGIFGGSYVMVDGARQDVAPGETVEVTKVSGNVYKFVGSAGFTFVADVAK
jgi:hypothetical protein